MTFQQYFLPAVVIGVGSIIIVLIIVCVKCFCCRGQKWSKGSLTSYDEKWKGIEYFSTKEDMRRVLTITRGKQ
jgi:hypothetical protein